MTADMCLTADAGVASWITARSHTFVEIDHEIILTILLPSADSRSVVVSCKGKYVYKLLVKPLSQACPGKKCGLGELTVPT